MIFMIFEIFEWNFIIFMIVMILAWNVMFFMIFVNLVSLFDDFPQGENDAVKNKKPAPKI